MRKIYNKLKNNINDFIYLIYLYFISCFSFFYYAKRKTKSNDDNKNKKIMILIGSIGKGGAERAVVNLAEKLSKKYEVIIVTYHNGRILKEVEDYQCNVRHIHIHKEKFWRIKRIKKIKQIKKENKITHCISFGTIPNYLNAITRIDEKVIISIRNYISIAECSKELKIRNKIASKLSDYIVAVSEDVKEDYIKTYKINPKKITTIYNYCNKEYIEESIQKYDIDECDKKIFEDGKVILTVGKLKKQKGVWHLIIAFKKILEKHKDAKLVILGIGELEEYLKNLIKDMHLENNVYMLGHKNKNIYTYMKNSDIFVLPSLFEGMPNVILEAMECGLPIIATDCHGGNREIIEPGYEEKINCIRKCKYGILIPKLDFNYHNAEDKITKEEMLLADAINEMLENEKLAQYYRQKSLERVNDFNKESYIEKWEEIL